MGGYILKYRMEIKRSSRKIIFRQIIFEDVIYVHTFIRKIILYTFIRKILPEIINPSKIYLIFGLRPAIVITIHSWERDKDGLHGSREDVIYVYTFIRKLYYTLLYGYYNIGLVNWNIYITYIGWVGGYIIKYKAVPVKT